MGTGWKWGAALIGLLLVFLGFAHQERQLEAYAIRDQARADSIQDLEVRLDSTKLAYRRDTIRLRQLEVRWDTARITVEHWKRDTLEVVRYVTLADSTIQACRVALGTCEHVAQVLREAGWLWERRYRDARRQQARPWTAAGVAVDPVTQRLGAFVDRDLWRLRLGASATPGRVELRAGVRW